MIKSKTKNQQYVSDYHVLFENIFDLIRQATERQNHVKQNQGNDAEWLQLPQGALQIRHISHNLRSYLGSTARALTIFTPLHTESGEADANFIARIHFLFYAKHSWRYQKVIFNTILMKNN